VGHKKKDIDEEAQEADQEVENAHNKQHKQVPRGVGGAVEVGDHSENEHDKS
jgi:hypothetical protein